MTGNGSGTEQAYDCPEYACGIKMRREELKAHLQWDHNRSEFRAERILEEDIDTGDP